ncbi:hypothetical protein Bca52824_022145 [Brassica carinata]|uniref:KIB1-4 beta-propeller domain-containing protein n=1 Tax=Brassica carinata TaxID=52824 RepID=A0A8X7VG56_BRACI|nr:hypothetical protein Bca52824_022145 [Brassica carinata]
MSLFLSRLRTGGRRPSVSLLISNGFSTSLRQTPPYSILGAKPCGQDFGRLIVHYANLRSWIHLDKRVPMNLVHDDEKTQTIGASHGWIATLKDDGILRLQDDFNPVTSDIDPIRIQMPPLVTLPHCQTKIITNVSMSSSFPEDDEDCVVAVKFLGPQLSFCKPAGKSRKPEWTNIKIENPCFYSSRVMFSKKDNMFRMPGSGGHLIGSWDPCNPSDDPKLQRVRFTNIPKLTNDEQNLMDSCSKSEHLVESRPTGETFLVKQYKKTAKNEEGVAIMKTEILMVFKLDEEGNAVYTQDIGDLTMFLSMSEPFCVPSTSFPGLARNYIRVLDVNEIGCVNVANIPFSIGSINVSYSTPYYFPPQDY